MKFVDFIRIPTLLLIAVLASAASSWGEHRRDAGYQFFSLQECVKQAYSSSGLNMSSSGAREYCKSARVYATEIA